MAIDIRATVTCSLGTLISASISDDYVQGTGLIKCKGTCEISGIVTPAVGAAVTFSYTKGGVTRSIPRKLRVLSSFADPFRRTTQVELGCKLTYLADLQEKVNWDAFDDTENSSLTSADAEIITIPIHASSIAAQCCLKLGIGGAPALTNTFSIKEFDFSAGYVSILSDLMVSESLCGYLDESETLVTFSLDQGSGTGPVIDSSNIIDLGPIGVGQLPGEAVTVSYSTLKLKNSKDNASGDNVEDPTLWDSTSSSNQHSVVYSYTVGTTLAIKTYNIIDSSYENTSYQEITKPDGEKVTVPEKRLTIETTGSAAVLGGLVTEYLSKGLAFNNEEITNTTSEFFYYDKYGNETLYIKDTIGSRGFMIGTFGLPFVFSATDYVSIGSLSQTVPIEYVVRRTDTVGEFQKVATETYGSWARTIAGQQAIAAARDNFTTATQVSSYIESLLNASGGVGNRGLFLIDASVSTQRRTDSQRAPSKADKINAANADPQADPANGYRTESSSELELALGSATAQRRIELSMPYAPDDRFVKTGSSPATYSSVKSDAPAKAARYGRCQNRLLLGNRSGMNIQTLPELLPAAPFSPIIVQANGLSAMYRTNGTSWQMSADGILVSTDALFYGAVGGTGTFWFPVAPGITTLPTTPAVVDGQMTVTNVVPVWNETVKTEARLRVGLGVQSLSYPLTLLTEPDPLRVRMGFTARRILKVEPPAAALTIAASVPQISIGTAVNASVGGITISAQAPAIASSMTAVILNAPAANIGIATSVPIVNEEQDLYFSSVSLLTHFDDTNGSTTFADSSNNALALSNSGSPTISTAQSKFGGSSLALVSSSSQYLSASNTVVNLGAQSNSWTVEAWLFLTSSSSRQAVWHNGTLNNQTNSWRCYAEFNSSTFRVRATGINSNYNTEFNAVAGTYPYALNTWYHIAITMDGTTLRVYVNGTEHASATGAGWGLDIAPPNTFYIGAMRWDGSTTNYLDGYIDDFRITKGIARYTSNFTLPTKAFPNL